MKKKISFSLLLLIGCMFFMQANDFDPDSLISDINYDYEITSGYYEDQYWTECLGTLSMSIEVPDSVEEIRFSRATKPIKNHPPFYNVHAYIDVSGKSRIDVKREQVRHDCYFRVVFYTKDRSYPSSNFAVKDLISPEDLERLQETNSAFEINDDLTQIEVKNGKLIVLCNYKCDINVFSIDGKSTYTNSLCQDTEIPLPSGMNIVSISYNNKCQSKKIIIK